MNSELIKLVEQAVTNGISTSSWIVFLVGLFGTIVGAFGGSYLSMKAQHLATKEDFDDLLKQQIAQISATETIKGEIGQTFTNAIEALRTELQETLFYRTQILLPRLDAYKALWALTNVVRPTKTDPITDGEKEDLEREMTEWYYKNGNGIFMSLEVGELWRTARRTLTQSADEEIKGAFKALRTQIKKDIKIYGEKEADTELGM